MKLKEPIAIVMPRRSPIGKVGGQFAILEPHELLAQVLRPILADGGANVRYDDVIIGNVRNGIGNIGRVTALAAGLPVDTPAITVDRQCASSLEAVGIAAAKIGAGLAEAVVVGGVESASRCPWLYERTARPYAYQEPQPFKVRLATEEVGDPPMGETAEILADEFGIAREDMDAFSADSHSRATAALEAGAFGEEIIPIAVPGKRGASVRLDQDETIRPETTPEGLATLRPVFRKDGRVTAGNSSPLSDGAAACIVASREACEKHGWTPAVWLRGIATVALEPRRMGLGPALAMPRVLDACGHTLDDIDLVEINEAFACADPRRAT